MITSLCIFYIVTDFVYFYKLLRDANLQLELDLKGKKERTHWVRQCVACSASPAPVLPEWQSWKSWHLPLLTLRLQATHKGHSCVIWKAKRNRHPDSAPVGAKWGLWRTWTTICNWADASDSFMEILQPPVSLKTRHSPVFNTFLLEYLELFYIFDPHDDAKT